MQQREQNVNMGLFFMLDRWVPARRSTSVASCAACRVGLTANEES